MSRFAVFALALILPPATAGALWAAYSALTQRHAVAEYPVAAAVRYQCRYVTPGPGHGWVHITKTDLTDPRIDLYVSRELHERSPFPLELQAVDRIAAEEDLIVAVNGTLFGSDSQLYSKLQRPGDPAYSTETVVAQGHISKGRLPVDVRLVWFDQPLVFPPVATTSNGQSPAQINRGLQGHWLDVRGKAPEEVAAVLSTAIDVVGFQNSQLQGGQYDWAPDDIAGRRTAVGTDSSGRTLYLAVFESATLKQVADTLKSEGATDVACVDGGHSSAMVVDQKVVTGNWRPVAVTLGVRFRPK